MKTKPDHPQTTLRSHQREAIDKAKDYFLSGGRCFRFHFITAGGKTISAIHAAEEVREVMFEEASIVVSAHTIDLKDQFRRDYEDQKKREEWFDGFWSFHTYQSLVKKKRAEFGSKKKPLILIIDEAHQGGITKIQRGSYQKIVDELKPSAIICLTATDAGLDEKIFGPKTAENTFCYNFSDAMDDGFVNCCDLITIHTGLQQDLVHKEISGKERRLSAERLEEIQQEYEKLGVDVKCRDSSRAIALGNIEAALDVYFEKEANLEKGKLNQCVFFLRTIYEASLLRDLFLLRVRSFKKSPLNRLPDKAICRSSHSRSDSDDPDLLDFRAGLFPVLTNVRQAQEGMNVPGLARAFDLAPSVTNEGRLFLQRLGRLLRVTPGKPKSRYYTFVTIGPKGIRYNFDEAHESILTSGKLYPKEDLSEIEAHLDVAIDARRAIEARHGEKNNRSVLVSTPDTEKLSKKGSGEGLSCKKEKDTLLVKSRLIVSKAEGKKILHKITLQEIIKKLDRNPEQKKKEILAFYIQHDRWPSLKSRDLTEKRLARNLYDYTSPDAGATHAAFQKKVRALGFGQPSSQSEKNKKAIREFYTANGCLPKRRSTDPNEAKLAKAMANLCSRKSKLYSEPFAEEINALKGRAAENPETRILEIKAFYEEHRRLPVSNQKDKHEHGLAKYLYWLIGVENVHKYKRLRLWAESKGYQDRSAPQHKSNLIAFIDEHKRLPMTGSKTPKEKKAFLYYRVYAADGAPLYDKQLSAQIQGIQSGGRKAGEGLSAKKGASLYEAAVH